LEGDLTPEAMLKLADKMLYKAKQSGRNCVKCAKKKKDEI